MQYSYDFGALHLQPPPLILDTAARRYQNAFFGQGTGAINMDNVVCIGNESRLIDCPYDPDASDDTHAEDAGVKCWPTGEKNYQT